MKLTKSQLKQIIKEELKKLSLKELLKEWDPNDAIAKEKEQLQRAHNK